MRRFVVGFVMIGVLGACGDSAEAVRAREETRKAGEQAGVAARAAGDAAAEAGRRGAAKLEEVGEKGEAAAETARLKLEAEMKEARETAARVTAAGAKAVEEGTEQIKEAARPVPPKEP